MTIKDIPYPHYILNAAGRVLMVHEPKVIDLGSQDDAIAKASESTPRLVPGAFKLDSLSVGLAANGTSITLWASLPHLFIDTHWLIDATAKTMTAAWVKGPNSVRQTLKWTPDAGMKLWLVSRHSQKDGNWVLGLSYMLCTKDGKEGTLVPPLPNIHGTGEICTGNPRFRNIGPLLSDQFAALVNHMNATPWNTDLIKHEVHTFFTYDISGKEPAQKPFHRAWPKLLATCNLAEYSNLPLK